MHGHYEDVLEEGGFQQEMEITMTIDLYKEIMLFLYTVKKTKNFKFGEECIKNPIYCYITYKLCVENWKYIYESWGRDLEETNYTDKVRDCAGTTHEQVSDYTSESVRNFHEEVRISRDSIESFGRLLFPKRV